MIAKLSQKSKAPWWLAIIIAILIAPMIAACQEKANSQSVEIDGKAAHARGTEISLTLTGYNYTNRYIDQFSVDGLGGGNLFVSTPHGGGGGDVCCVAYIMGARAWKAPVHWQVDACRYDERVYSDGTKHFDIFSIMKEVEVQIDPNIPANPKYLEVHFYPDEHVEAAITEHSSSPRLILNSDREDKSHYRQCPNNKKPAD